MKSKEFFTAEFDKDNNGKDDKKEDSKKKESEGETFKDKIEMVKKLNENPEKSEAVIKCSDKDSWSSAKSEIAKKILDGAKEEQRRKEDEGFSSNQGEIQYYRKKDKKSEKKSETE